MARPQELKNPVRVNYVIEKAQDKALRELSSKTNRTLSELIRQAIDGFLGTEFSTMQKPVKGEIADVIALIEFMAMKISTKGKKSEWELKRANLSLMFGSQWWKIKSVVEMTAHAMCSKGIDVMQEEIILQQEVSGTQRLKQEKYGFKIITAVPVTRKDLNKLIKEIELDAKAFGRIIPKVNGGDENGETDSE